MQLERYSRQEAFEPTPQTRGYARSPQPPTNVPQPNIGGLMNSVAGAIKSVGSIATAFNKLNDDRKATEAWNKYGEVSREFKDELYELRKSSTDQELQDKYEELEKQYRSRLMEEVPGWKQRRMIMNHWQNMASNQFATTTKNARIEATEERNAAIQGIVNEAVSAGDISMAYGGIYEGLADGTFNYQNLDLDDETIEKVKALVEKGESELTSATERQDLRIQFQFTIEDAFAEKEANGEVIPDDSLIPTIEREVEFQKAKNTIDDQGSYAEAYNRLMEDPDFLDEFGGSKREELLNYTKQRMDDEYTIQKRAQDRVHQEAEQAAREAYSNGNLTFTKLDALKDKMDNSSYRWWHGLLKRQAKAVDETATDELIGDARVMHNQLVDTINRGNFNINEMTDKILQLGVAYSESPKAGDEFNADSLLEKAYGNAMVGTDNAYRRSLKKLRSDGTISDSAYNRIEAKINHYVSSHFFDKDTGQPVDDPPSQTEMNAAIGNLIRDDLEGEVKKGAVDRLVGKIDTDYDVDDFLNWEGDEFGTTGIGKNHVENALEVINAGGLIGREDEPDVRDSLQKFQKAALKRFYSAFGYTPESNEIDMQLGGVMAITTRSLTEEEMEKTAQRLYPHREPTKQEKKLLQNGGQFVLDTEEFQASRLGGLFKGTNKRETFVPLEEFKNRHPVYSGVNDESANGLTAVRSGANGISGLIRVGSEWVSTEELDQQGRLDTIQEGEYGTVYLRGDSVNADAHVGRQIVEIKGTWHILRKLQMETGTVDKRLESMSEQHNPRGRY